MLEISRGSVVLYDETGDRWLLFRRPRAVYEARSLDETLSCLDAVAAAVSGQGLWAAGYIAYEAGPAFDAALPVRSTGGVPLIWFGLYDHPEAIVLPRPPEGPPPRIDWHPALTESEYRRCFRTIKQYIREGDTYQVNFTFRLRALFGEDPFVLFLRMVQAQGRCYGAYIDAGRWCACSASPELFFRRSGDELTCRPMKGTAPRGMTREDDLRVAGELSRSEKNRAENVMIVDMVRNDMGRIARPGTVDVADPFRIEQYPTLWQMTSTVRCRTDASAAAVMSALFPCASITGAPKVRTTEIIRELEGTPRKIYTGTIGYFAPGNRAQFNVAIRTVLLDRETGCAEYGTGGGIVWDSERKDELNECYTKARILTQATPSFALLETMLWTPSDGIALLEQHLARLFASAAYFSRSVSRETIRRKLGEVTSCLSGEPRIIRLLVGPGDGEVAVEDHPVRPLPDPYRVSVARDPVSRSDPFLYHKTTFRRVYDEARTVFPEQDDVLLWNDEGEMTESCIANLVVEQEGRLLTPPRSCGLLGGIGRLQLLGTGKIEERVIRRNELERCSRLFLVNALRGLWEIRLDRSTRQPGKRGGR